MYSFASLLQSLLLVNQDITQTLLIVVLCFRVYFSKFFDNCQIVIEVKLKKMGKNVPLSEVERAQIVALHKEGHSEQLISQKMKKSKTAVHNAMAKFRNTGTYTTAKKSGRPRKTTPRDDHAIRRIVVRSPMSSASKIRSSLLAKGTDISRRTVSRRLVDDFDLKAHKPAHKPRLTQAMKSNRLAFAKKHVKWTIQQWQQVLFSDESTVQQFTN